MMQSRRSGSLRRTSGSAYVNWAGNQNNRGRANRAGAFARAVSPKQNPSVVSFLEFEPDIPEGFQSADAFLDNFADRPELKDLMPDARRRVERARARAKAPNYKTTLASLRRTAGLSQAELAKRLGTVQPVISMYESGEREPSLKAIHGLAEALDVSFNELLPALKHV